nr:META domain-containing protein [Kibdelosporangium sp. MJ126-NF4]CEL22111.1 hypothetical protein [Kibdelosporangium sp. MJ126-NF4]CTQ92892.1 hypothetical protein [Kibdelosporangium sp. MJ126-NF4]
MLAAGCGGVPGAPSGNAPGQDIPRQVFVSQAVTEQGKPRPLVDGTRIRFEITDRNDLRVKAGCNHISSSVDTSGARLSVGEIRLTEMGCDKARHDQDTWLTGILSGKPEWKYDGTTLTVSSGGTEIRFAAKAPATLEGTMWVANGIVEKDTVTSLQTPTWVSFANGVVQSGSPCNSAEGSYQATTGKVTVREMTPGEASCPQADEIMPFLQGELGYRIDDETLTLTNPSGKGLQLRAGAVDSQLAGKEFVAGDGKTVLRFKDGKLTATVGCNDLTGTAVVDNGKLIIQRLARTRKACEPALMAEEDRLAKLLTGFSDIKVTQTGFQLGDLTFTAR